MAYSIVAVILLYSGIVAGRHTVLLQCYYCTMVLLHGGIQNCSCVLFLSSGIVAWWNTVLLCCVSNVQWYCCTVEHSIVVLCFYCPVVLLQGGIQYCRAVITVQWYCCTVAFSIVALYHYCTVVSLHGGIQYCCGVLSLYSGIVARLQAVFLLCVITVQWYCCTVGYSIVALCSHRRFSARDDLDPRWRIPLGLQPEVHGLEAGDGAGRRGGCRAVQAGRSGLSQLR